MLPHCARHAATGLQCRVLGAVDEVQEVEPRHPAVRGSAATLEEAAFDVRQVIEVEQFVIEGEVGEHRGVSSQECSIWYRSACCLPTVRGSLRRCRPP